MKAGALHRTGRWQELAGGGMVVVTLTVVITVPESLQSNGAMREGNTQVTIL